MMPNAALAPSGTPSKSAYLPAAAVAKVLIPMIGALAGFPLLARVLGMAGLHSRFLFLGLETLLQLATFIVFLVWNYRIVSAVRQTTGDSRFSPGLAVGCWFIPFANFVMPFLSLGDTWRRATGNDSRGFIVPAWWFSYLGLTVLRTALQNMHWTRDTIGIANALGWLVFLLAIGSATAWLLMVQWITQKTEQ